MFQEGKTHHLCQKLLLSKQNENLNVATGFYNVELFGDMTNLFLLSGERVKLE